MCTGEYHDCNSPQLRAFSVIQKLDGHGRIPLPPHFGGVISEENK